MASLYKLQQDKKRKPEEEESSKTGFKAIKQKVLILSSRGITARQRFLLNDLISLIPHSKKDTKLDTKSQLYQLNELADLYNCNNIIFAEARKHLDLYLHLAKAPNGPTFKLHLQNLHTMDELNLTGNCLKGSRPVLSFDATFDSKPHFKVLKELMMQMFQVPVGARRSKPFVDHIVTLTILDNKIWFRNYQIKETQSEEGLGLVEIGPRFCMTLIHVLESSFSGPLIYQNKEFVSPNTVRRLEKQTDALRYRARRTQGADQVVKRSKLKVEKGPLDNNVLFA